MSKLRTVFLPILLLLVSCSIYAEEVVYLVHSTSSTGSFIQGAAYTNSDRLEVDGYVVLERKSRVGFAGIWTRSGKIEAVDRYGNMYLFDVIGVLEDKQARNFAQNL